MPHLDAQNGGYRLPVRGVGVVRRRLWRGVWLRFGQLVYRLGPLAVAADGLL